MNPWTGLSPAIKYRPPAKKARAPERQRTGTHPQIDNPWSLSPIECAVMEHLVEGLTAKEIGKAIGRAEKTIEAHLHNCRKAMGKDRRIQAAIAWDRFQRPAERRDTEQES